MAIKKNKSLVLAVTPSIKLRDSQAKLYAFIVGKHEAGSTITLPEVIEQYIQYGNRNNWGGVARAYGVDRSGDKWNYTLIPLKGDELRLYAVQWFIRNLGIFVIKGLLTAIPTMELSDIQIEETA